MNINKLYKPDMDKETRICKRAKLDTGYFCNYRCSFCYYIKKITEVTPFEKIKERIDFLKSEGATEVDLSGGESSAHQDWFKILDACSVFPNISTLSNGSMFYDKDFIKKSYDKGLKEILFSLHGTDAKTHDKVVKVKGAYEKLIQSIYNAKTLGITVRINIVITPLNYNRISTDFLKKLNPLEINFLTLNHWSEYSNVKEFDYKISTDSIKQYIDKLESIKYINVRYTPYCYMKGYEKYVCNIYQHIYDIYDWDMTLYNYEHSNNDKLDEAYRIAYNDRCNLYIKPKKCSKCKFVRICDGIENENIDVYPEEGDKIKEVNYFRKEFYD